MTERRPADRIELRGLRVLGRHGALPGEQDQPQPFELDLDVEADLAPAGSSDRLPETVDYGVVAERAAAVVSQERWQLLERLAQRVAEEVLAADSRISAVTVAVRKLRPPLAGLRTAGVRIWRRRGQPSSGGGADEEALPAGPKRRVFLGLGANLGQREQALRTAVAALPDVTTVSPLYETEPVGGPPGQPPYLNLVVELRTDLSPRQLLELAGRLEREAGRVRGERHGPRPLDVDVLWVEGITVDEPDLVVPHPRMSERAFVLAPLADVAPDLVPADWNQQAQGEVRRLGRL